MIPNTIKIGGRVYKVTFAEQVDETDNNVDGMIFYSKQEIRLKKI